MKHKEEDDKIKEELINDSKSSFIDWEISLKGLSTEGVKKPTSNKTSGDPFSKFKDFMKEWIEKNL